MSRQPVHLRLACGDRYQETMRAATVICDLCGEEPGRETVEIAAELPGEPIDVGEACLNRPISDLLVYARRAKQQRVLRSVISEEAGPVPRQAGPGDSGPGGGA